MECEWDDSISRSCDNWISDVGYFDFVDKQVCSVYISISETWHKIYQIFRRVLINEIEYKFYENEKEKSKSAPQHLKTKKKEEHTTLKEKLIEKEDNNLNIITSQNKLVENDEVKTLRENKQNNIVEKDGLIDNEPTEELNKDDLEKRSEKSDR